MLNPYFKPEEQRERSVQLLSQASVQEFNQARRRAAWRRILGRLSDRSSRLKDLEREWAEFRGLPHREAGLQTVPLEKITGSLGRSADFDRDFQPLSDRARDRWTSLHSLYHRSGALPPVKLFELCGEYYVVDGHHRLSVGRSHGQLDIEAEVTRLLPAACARPEA